MTEVMGPVGIGNMHPGKLNRYERAIVRNANWFIARQSARAILMPKATSSTAYAAMQR